MAQSDTKGYLSLSLENLVQELLSEEAIKDGLSHDVSLHMNDIDKVIRAFDDIMSVSRNLQIQYRRRKNQLAPLNRLPPEILHRVLQITLSNVSWKDHYSTLLSLRLVTERWASIIDGTPNFWTLLPSLRNENLVDLILEKSSNCPLHVRCFPQPRSYDFAQKLISIPNFGERLEMLALEGLSDAIEAQFWPLAFLPAPNLTTLHLTRMPRERTKRPLFQGVAPKLREVLVDRVSTHWKSPLFTGLTSLTWRNVGDAWMSTQELVNKIRESPDIAKLELDRVSVVPSTEEPGPPMKLERLQTFILKRMHSAIAAYVLRSFVIPPEAQVHVTVDMVDDIPSHPLFPPLRTWFTNFDRNNAPRQISLRLIPGILQITYVGQLTLTFLASEDVMHALADLLQNLTLAVSSGHLTDIELDTIGWSSGNVHHCLRVLDQHLPSITAVDVKSSRPHFLPLLDSAGGGGRIFPRMESLKLGMIGQVDLMDLSQFLWDRKEPVVQVVVDQLEVPEDDYHNVVAEHSNVTVGALHCWRSQFADVESFS